MGVGTHVEIKPLCALKGTCRRRVEDGNELDDVGIDAEFCASTNPKDLGLSAALDANPEIGFKSGSAGLDSNRQGLAAESVTCVKVSNRFALETMP